MSTNTLHTPRRIVVTGGAGFIGANFIHYVLQHSAAVILNIDALTYAGGKANLDELAQCGKDRYSFEQADINDLARMQALFGSFAPDTVVHFAAESHVDRSIDGPLQFIRTNVLGTANLLEAARAAWAGRQDVRFHHISTDEVYGSLGADGFFCEDTPYDPSSPYSASKAGSDHLVRAWHRTFGLPVTLSNCSNNYGPRQFPEKLIPLMIGNALAGKALPVYGKGANVRDWLHVEDHCSAIWTIVTRGVCGRSYNIGGNNEWSNIDLVRLLCRTLDELRPDAAGSRERLITFVTDRPGHDLRYAIDSSRIASELNWKPSWTFETGLRQTIKWYLENASWMESIRSSVYDGRRLGLGK